MIDFSINGVKVRAEEGTTILAAAKSAGVKIPTLCYNPDLPAWASCGICVVRVAGSPKLLRSCCTTVDASYAGKNVITHDEEIVSTRRTLLELILSDHPNDCLKCSRNGNCELQTLSGEFGIRDVPYKNIVRDLPIDDSNVAITLDPNKCIRCGRCVKVCQDVQNVWALEFIGRGIKGKIAAAADVSLAEGPCIKCGQCTAHCPVGALYERDDTAPVWAALHNPEIHTVVQIAPAVRVAIGEEFGLEPGALLTGKLYAALRRLGFDTVFDTNFGADLTVIEEGNELVKRLKTGEGAIPLITSCCPSWVDYLEKYYPDMIPNFSTAKSPMQELGAMVKTYWAGKAGIAPEKIYQVAVMPCTAKKWETGRNDDMKSASRHLGKDVGYDVDMAITVREIARMIRLAGIDIVNLPDEESDSPLGPYSGAGTIFGVSGGVMEASVRTAHSLMTGRELPDVEFSPARGLDGVKEAELDLAGTKVRIAVAHQMGNIAAVLDKIRESRKAGKEPPYHFIEVMACRGGCISGGGQPYGAVDEIRKKRGEGLYGDDRKSKYRSAHENPLITELYREFLGEPNGHKAHELLHTSYVERGLYEK